MRSNGFAQFIEECGEKGQNYDAITDPDNEYWALKEEVMRAFNRWRRTKTNKPDITSLGKFLAYLNQTKMSIFKSKAISHLKI